MNRGTAGSGEAARWRSILFTSVVGCVCFMAGGVVGLYFQPPGLAAVFRVSGLEPGAGSKNPVAVAVPDPPSRERSEIGADVVGLGRLIPRGDVVTVAPPYGAGDARIEELEVSVGDRVDAGDVVAVLDSLDARQAVLDLAEASVAIREAALSQTKSSVQSSRRQTQAALNRAKTLAKEADASLARTRRLHKQGIATDAELEGAQSRADQASASVTEGRATLSRYAKGSKASQADVLVATRNLASAEAELESAKQDVERAYVRAPSAGVVLEVHSQPGERPGTEGVVTLGDIDSMIAEVEIYQDLIGRVSMGDPVELVADALPVALRGEVDSIGLTVQRQEILDGDPAANVDARVVRVLVALDPESSKRARSFTNLEVVARISSAEDPS